MHPNSGWEKARPALLPQDFWLLRVQAEKLSTKSTAQSVRTDDFFPHVFFSTRRSDLISLEGSSNRTLTLSLLPRGREEESARLRKQTWTGDLSPVSDPAHLSRWTKSFNQKSPSRGIKLSHVLQQSPNFIQKYSWSRRFLIPIMSFQGILRIRIFFLTIPCSNFSYDLPHKSIDSVSRRIHT